MVASPLTTLVLSFLLLPSPLAFADEVPDGFAADPPLSPGAAYDSAISSLSRLRRSSLQPKQKGLGRYLRHVAKSFFLSANPAAQRDLRTNGPLRRAVAELQAAADQRHPDAIYVLADMNFFGNYSHPRNFTEAFRRYNQLAILNGNASAQHMLAFMYSTGVGGAVKPDQARAMLYYSAAAQQGNERSQMALAYRHYVGISTPRNCQAAVRLYKKVAERAIDFVRSGPPSDRTMVRQAYRISDDEGGIYGEGASASSSGQNSRPKPVNSDAYATFEDVLEYLDLVSKKGDLKATFQLGKYHYEGSRGLKPNFKLSSKYFLEVYQQHENKLGKGRKEYSSEEKLAYRAVGYLGRMALRGDGMEQNFRRAKVWLNMGVAGGDAQSQYFLGLMYLDGLAGVEKNPKRAADLFTAAADQDYAPAQVRLAVLFLDVGDSQTALRYLELAARHGHMEALYYLAELSWTGTGRDASCQLAAHYFKAVSEKADIVDSSIQEANLAHELGDADLALIDYMLAAEQGFESAQTNVAFLLDKAGANPRLAALRARLYDMLSMVPQRVTLPPSPGTGLLYWTRSARQLNVDSLVKMGDYYLVGRDDTAVDSDKAAACYGAAAETLQSAQALWNLGWMHENGVGGLEQDFHLAKRFYDQALEINSEAYLAVVLALAKLRLRSRWNQWTRGGIKSIVEDDAPRLKPRTFRAWLAAFLEADAAMHGHGPLVGDDDADAAAVAAADRAGGAAGDGGDREMWSAIDADGRAQPLTDEELWDEALGGVLESAVILVLAFSLAALVLYRRQRADVQRNREEDERRRRERERAAEADGAAGGAAGREAREGDEQRDRDRDRGMFPRMGDPAFMDWAVGGVGH